jgi:hypothetical protein
MKEAAVPAVKVGMNLLWERWVPHMIVFVHVVTAHTLWYCKGYNVNITSFWWYVWVYGMVWYTSHNKRENVMKHVSTTSCMVVW